MTTPARPLRLPRYPLPASPTSTSDWRRHDDDTDPTLPPEGPLQFEE